MEAKVMQPCSFPAIPQGDDRKTRKDTDYCIRRKQGPITQESKKISATNNGSNNTQF